MLDVAMRLLYRIQQHVSITEYELRVLLVLCLLFGSGLALKALQSRPQELPPGIYDDDLRLLREGLQAHAASPDSSRVPGGAARAVMPDLAPPPNTLSHMNPGVDINTATATMLVGLPEIGPATAARILDYRKRRGNFEDVDELMRVRGIGPKTLAVLRPHVHVHRTDDSTATAPRRAR